MAIERKPAKPRLELGDVEPTVQLAKVTSPIEEKIYFSAYVPRPLFDKIRLATTLEGFRQPTDFLQKVMGAYLAEHHPKLFD